MPPLGAPPPEGAGAGAGAGGAGAGAPDEPPPPVLPDSVEPPEDDEPELVGGT